jgi:hypothetical protein
MARLDFKKGRFDPETYEVNEIYKALEGWQISAIGTTVDYYRFDFAASQSHDIYDEGYGVGRVYNAPFPMPVLHATHNEGGREDRMQGLYFNDNIHLSASFDQLRKIGLTRQDIDSRNYQTDRIVYDNRVFTVTNIQVLGQIRSRDIMVGIDGSQVAPDQLVNDQQFKKWSA